MTGEAFKMVAINGSHRSEKGFTEIILRQFIEGAMAANAQCEVVYPSKSKIVACECCDDCLLKTPGQCKFNDDMGAIISQLEAADFLVFASPVYFDGMSSNMKKLIERLRPTYGAHFEFRNGRTFHLKTNKKRQKVVIIATAGNPERESFDSMDKNFRRIIDNMGAELAGEFYFPASHFFVTHPERVAGQLEAVALAGKELASYGKISEDLLMKANKEYIDDPEAVVQDISRMIQVARRNYRDTKREE